MSPKRPAKPSNRVHHLHIVVDDALLQGVEGHVTTLGKRLSKGARQPSLSSAARDLIRRALKIKPVRAA